MSSAPSFYRVKLNRGVMSCSRKCWVRRHRGGTHNSFQTSWPPKVFQVIHVSFHVSPTYRHLVRLLWKGSHPPCQAEPSLKWQSPMQACYRQRDRQGKGETQFLYLVQNRLILTNEAHAGMFLQYKTIHYQSMASEKG